MAKVRTAGVTGTKRTKRKSEETSTGKTCVEPIIRLTDEQKIIQNLSWIQFQINKKKFSGKEIQELLEITTKYAGIVKW